jgi:predicted acylesterase/phospholipase RssA
MGVIRTLIFAGGGGRRAFHAGVTTYRYQEEKLGEDCSHQGNGKPEIVTGTSIGAVNGTARAFRKDYPDGEIA